MALSKSNKVDKNELADDDLAVEEFEMLKESYKEALMIKKGLKNAIPVTELWSD